jgi:hypothetical protein
MTSGSKNGTQIYYLFLSKVPANKPPPGSPKSPYRQGGPFTGHFAYLSKTSFFEFPSKEPVPDAPYTDPLEREVPHSQSSFIQLSGPR